MFVVTLQAVASAARSDSRVSAASRVIQAGAVAGVSDAAPLGRLVGSGENEGIMEDVVGVRAALWAPPLL